MPCTFPCALWSRSSEPSFFPTSFLLMLSQRTGMTVQRTPASLLLQPRLLWSTEPESSLLIFQTGNASSILFSSLEHMFLRMVQCPPLWIAGSSKSLWVCSLWGRELGRKLPWTYSPTLLHCEQLHEATEHLAQGQKANQQAGKWPETESQTKGTWGRCTVQKRTVRCNLELEMCGSKRNTYCFHNTCYKT